MRSLLVLLLLAACPGPAAVPTPMPAPLPDAGPPAASNPDGCPAAGESGKLAGVCRGSAGTCRYGDWDCQCQGPLGGAARPPWWQCHQARHKPDGCADDEALASGAACTQEGQVCAYPRPCNCSFTTQVTCTGGAWQMPPACPGCRAP